MEVSPLVWGLTIAAIVGLLAFDFFFHVRRAHAPSLREAATWSAVYLGLAVLFGLGVLAFGGGAAGSEYFAGYVTEKALSVDNLFVFLIILTSFRVPREDQQKVVLYARPSGSGSIARYWPNATRSSPSGRSTARRSATNRP